MKTATLLSALLGACAAAPHAAADPALRLHGHNDYLQLVPLRRALELGLGSVEVDVYLVEGELRVGHERWQLRRGRTLSSLYLDPLLAATRAGRAARGAAVVPLGVIAPGDPSPDLAREQLSSAGAARVLQQLEDLLELLA